MFGICRLLPLNARPTSHIPKMRYNIYIGLCHFSDSLEQDNKHYMESFIAILRFYRIVNC